MDYVGETYGANSAQYRKQAILQDQAMAYIIPGWLTAGYSVLVSADHGMNNDGAHGGTTEDVRHVPLYMIRPDAANHGDTQATVSQLQIASTLCRLLDLPIPPSMRHVPIQES